MLELCSKLSRHNMSNPIRSHDRLSQRIRERERNRAYEYPPPCLVPITSRPNLSSCYGPLEKLWLDEMQRKKIMQLIIAQKIV